MSEDITSNDTTRIADKIMDILNTHDVEGFTKLCAEDIVFYNPAWEGPTGLSGVNSFLSDVWAGFPDLHYAERNRIVAGDTLVLECIATGTHKANWRGFAPTGRRAEWKMAFIITLANGKIRTWNAYFDRVTTLRQLGLMPQI